MKFFTSTTLTPDSSDMQPPTPEEDTLGDIEKALDQLSKYNEMTKRGHDHCVICGISPSELKEAIYEGLKAQRQADTAKIAFHFGLPAKDIEKVLESKV